jgi:hypothetical protein
MVLKFYGQEIDQKNLYRKSVLMDPTNKESLGCWDATIMLAMKDKKYLMEIWSDPKRNVELTKTSKFIFRMYKPKLEKAKKLGLIKEHKNADIKLIKNLLKKGIPVIPEIHSRTWYNKKNINNESTHTVVILGYKGKNFIVHDPFMSYYKKNGKSIKISFDHFKKAWEAPPYYKNNISIIVKMRNN